MIVTGLDIAENFKIFLQHKKFCQEALGRSFSWIVSWDFPNGNQSKLWNSLMSVHARVTWSKQVLLEWIIKTHWSSIPGSSFFSPSVLTLVCYSELIKACLLFVSCLLSWPMFDLNCKLQQCTLCLARNTECSISWVRYSHFQPSMQIFPQKEILQDFIGPFSEAEHACISNFFVHTCQGFGMNGKFAHNVGWCHCWLWKGALQQPIPNFCFSLSNFLLFCGHSHTGQVFGMKWQGWFWQKWPALLLANKK